MSCTNGVACEGEGDNDICADCFETMVSQIERLVQAYRKDYRSRNLEDEVAAAERLLSEQVTARQRLEPHFLSP